MSAFDELIKLAQQKAFLEAGGGQKDLVDKIAQILGTVDTGVSSFDAARKAQAERLKTLAETAKTQAETKKLTEGEKPVFSLFDLTGTRETSPETKAYLDRLFNAPGTETPDERIARLGQGIADKTQQLSSEQKPTLSVEDFKNVALAKGYAAAAGLKKEQAQTIFYNPTEGKVSNTPTPGYFPMRKEDALKEASKFAIQNSFVPTISAEDALSAGKVKKNTKIITPMQQGINPYAEVRGAQFIESDLPSNQSPTTASGAASQVQLAVRQGKGLIANPGSPQRLALASSDLARAVQRSAPQLETLAGAGFAENLLTKLSLLKQKATTDPSSADVPKLRKEVYDILDDLENTSRPIIERQLNVIENIYQERLPKNWEIIKSNQLGDNFPDIPFRENALPKRPQRNPVVPPGTTNFSKSLFDASAAIAQGASSESVKAALKQKYPNKIREIDDKLK